MKKETVFQVFLTKLDFWNLWSFWWHLWYLWHWCQWWFSSSLTKIPHNVGFIQVKIQHCEEVSAKPEPNHHWHQCQRSQRCHQKLQRCQKSNFVRNKWKTVWLFISKFLTMQDFWHLWCFCWHHWYLWHGCQWWFSSSSMKIPHNDVFQKNIVFLQYSSLCWIFQIFILPHNDGF